MKEISRILLNFSLYLYILLFQISKTSSIQCGKTFTDIQSGHVTSPRFPLNYPKYANCTWKIISTVGHRINLQVEHLENQEIHSGNPFCYDRIHIYQVLSNGRKKKVVYNLCGNSIENLDQTNYTINSTSPDPNTVEINFNSDHTNELPGFKIAFKILESTTSAPSKSSSLTTSISLQTADTTESLTVVEELTSNGNSSSVYTSENANQEYSSQSKDLVIILCSIGILFTVLLFGIVWFCFRKTRRKDSSNEIDTFRNLSARLEHELDEYGRPHENTYVEIPLLPNEEPPGHNGPDGMKEVHDRQFSRISLDSVAAAKLETALNNSPPTINESSSTSGNRHNSTLETATSNNVASEYSMAEDCNGNPSKIELNHKNSDGIFPTVDLENSYLNSRGSSQVSQSQKNESTRLPEGVYNVPTSPPCGPPDTDHFVYDHPKHLIQPKLSLPSLSPKSTLLSPSSAGVMESSTSEIDQPNINTSFAKSTTTDANDSSIYVDMRANT